MYRFKIEGLEINKTKASKIIGISRVYLTDILNRKKSCTKVIAYCITKYLNQEAEINDYFIRIEK